MGRFHVPPRVGRNALRLDNPWVRSTLLITVLILSGFPLALAQEELSATPREREALDAVRSGRFVRAREIAQEVLRQREDSVPGLYALGVALHHGEGNTPLGLRYLRDARGLLELEGGRVLPGEERWHEEVLWREAQALSDLGRYEELLAVYRRFRQSYGWEALSLDVWPLMKLGRIEEARAMAARAVASGDEYDAMVATNGLCAMDGYPACLAMLEAARKTTAIPALALGNAALSAMEIGRFDEAEMYLLEATRRPDIGSNPWRYLTNLYVIEGRLGEAAESAREMVEFSRFLPPRLREHQAAQNLVTSAELLLVAGEIGHAKSATERAMERPDRVSHISGSSGEMRAEVALLHRRVLLTAAELVREAAAVSPWRGGLAPRLQSKVLGFGAWRAGRQVLPLLQAGGLRPVLHVQSGDETQLHASEWLYPDAVELFGAGPTLALVAELRATPPGNEDRFPAELWNASLDALEAEALWRRGSLDAALVAAARAREAIPRGSVLLGARLTAIMADATRRLGLDERAHAFFDDLLATDPGALRRLGLALPVAVAGSRGDGLGARALRRAIRSPRFVRDDGSPFVLQARGERLCLLGPGGAQLACAEDPGGGDETAADEKPDLPSPERLADGPARLALALHEAAFAPRLDLSQQDLTTLDGSPTTQRGLDERVTRELVAP